MTLIGIEDSATKKVAITGLLSIEDLEKKMAVSARDVAGGVFTQQWRLSQLPRGFL
ncbi:hypothetical protein ACLOJK_023543 [Asimina triloba]